MIYTYSQMPGVVVCNYIYFPCFDIETQIYMQVYTEKSHFTLEAVNENIEEWKWREISIFQRHKQKKINNISLWFLVTYRRKKETAIANRNLLTFNNGYESTKRQRDDLLLYACYPTNWIDS